jgi:hypothetical protein
VVVGDGLGVAAKQFPLESTFAEQQSEPAGDALGEPVETHVGLLAAGLGGAGQELVTAHMDTAKNAQHAKTMKAPAAFCPVVAIYFI